MDTTATAPHQFGRRRKQLHLVRHAQGMHNLEPEKSRDRLTSSEFFDAQLSSLGWQQVLDQRKDVCKRGLLERTKLVIVSPMSRTLQTAVGIFCGDDQPDRLDITNSFEDSNEKMDETSTFNRQRIIACELCREQMGKYECDKRGTISQYRSLFPAVDFSLIENEDDVLWNPNERESREEVIARAIKFIKWLLEREEQEIAVVSHGVFLQHAMLQLTENYNCCPLMDDDPCSRFKNCEIRSVAIFNENVMGLGSDSMTTSLQYCGRIRNPYGHEVLQIRDSTNNNVSVEELEVTF